MVRNIKVSGPFRAPSSCSCPTLSGQPSSTLPVWFSLAFSPLTQVSGYLNLLANTIDNFTHGLAVAASFLVSKKVSGGWGRWGPGISGGNDPVPVLTHWLYLQNRSLVHHFLFPVSVTISSESPVFPGDSSPGHSLLLS